MNLWQPLLISLALIPLIPRVKALPGRGFRASGEVFVPRVSSKFCVNVSAMYTAHFAHRPRCLKQLHPIKPLSSKQLSHFVPLQLHPLICDRKLIPAIAFQSIQLAPYLTTKTTESIENHGFSLAPRVANNLGDKTHLKQPKRLCQESFTWGIDCAVS